MRCRQARGLLWEYAEGMLTPAQREQVERHLAGCEDCRQAAGQTAAAEQALHSLARGELAPELPVPWPQLNERPAWRWQPVAGLALLAAVVVVVALLAWPRPAARVQTTGPVTPVQTPIKGPVNKATEPPQALVAAAPEKTPKATITAARYRPAAGGNRRPLLRRQHRERVTPEVLVAKAPERPAATPPKPEGVVLVLGTPRPAPGSYTYDVQLTLPDGGGSRVVREQQVDESGTVTMVRCSNQALQPQGGQGG